MSYRQLILTLLICLSAEAADELATVPWEKMRAVPMSGDLKLFWNVVVGDKQNGTRLRRSGF